MTLVPVCLIEQNVLFREGLKSLLCDTDYQITNTYSSWNEAEQNLQTVQGSQLIILNSSEAKAAVSVLKEVLPACHIVVFADTLDVSQAISVFADGGDGYLLRSILPRALTGSMDMIMAGEKICPSAIMAMLAENNFHVFRPHTDKNVAKYNLSSREIEILQFLAFGESNKQIARNLDITEGTVKGHIKAVLRKLDVSNRTQAAIWAVNKGLGNTAGIPVV